MGILPRPLLYQSKKGNNSDNEYQSDCLQTDSSSSSSSHCSLHSQQSLPSVPSLTPPANQLELPSPTAGGHHCLSTLKGHASHVFSLSVVGKLLYSGSSDGQIRLWNKHSLNSGDGVIHDENQNVVASTQTAVKSIVVSGDRLFSAHQDHKIRVWKVEDSTAVQSQNGRQYRCVASMPTLSDRVTRLFSAGNYVEIRRHKKRTWVHHVDTVSALALSEDGSLLYSVSWDRTLKVWRASDFKCLESVWNAHDDAINSVAVAGDGFVYTGSADRKIKVWRRGEGEKTHVLVAKLEKHRSAVNALALSRCGDVLYSGACDRSIIVWEKGHVGEHMVVAGALRGHSKAILCLAVVGELVCSGSADKTVRVWRRVLGGKDYNCLGVLEGHGGPVKCLAADFDSNHSVSGRNLGLGKSYLVYSGSLDCDVKAWKIWVDVDDDDDAIES